MKRDAITHVEAPCESPLSRLAHVGFLTLPNFSMIAFTSAVEVLRMANYVGRAEHYRWSVITPDGEPARAALAAGGADRRARRAGPVQPGDR